MRLLEYEAKLLARTVGMPVPAGDCVSSVDDAVKTFNKIGKPVMLKVQIYAGARGKAGGIKPASTKDEVRAIASELFGAEIHGHVVDTLLVEEQVAIKEEYYLGITFDEIKKRDVLIFGRGGGVDVEDGKGANMVRFYLDSLTGLAGYEAKNIALKAGIRGKALNGVTRIILTLVELRERFETTTIEINPLALTESDTWAIADCRAELDDDGIVRVKGLDELGIVAREDRGRPPTELETQGALIDQEDHRGVAGRVVQFDGDIALIIGGGGASLTVFDAILNAGGKPANYCEIGGNPTVRKVARLTELLVNREGISKLAVITNVLSNTRVDLVARGVLKGLWAAGKDPATFPIVFRVPGSWEDEGYRILDKYGIEYMDRTHTMDEAAQRIVAL